MLEGIIIYFMVGLAWAFRASHYGQNPAGVPWWAYIETVFIWPYSMYLAFFVYRNPTDRGD